MVTFPSIPRLALACALAVCTARTAHAQALEGFNWVDLHEDAHAVEIVTRALAGKQYTALREIGYVTMPATGAAAPNSPDASADPVANTSDPAAPTHLPVPPDAHLLAIAATRKSPAALPSEDTFDVYDVDAKSATATVLLSGPALKFAGWLRMRRDGEPELVATYADCVLCQQTIFFTTFYPDAKTKAWTARWPRSRAGAPVYSEGQEANGGQQVYALLDDEAGRAMLATWQHFSGRKRRDSDFVYEYLVDNYTGQELTQPLAGADARAMESRLCHAQGVVLGIAGGQGSEICKSGAHAPSTARTASTHARRH